MFARLKTSWALIVNADSLNNSPHTCTADRRISTKDHEDDLIVMFGPVGMRPRGNIYLFESSCYMKVFMEPMAPVNQAKT